MPRRRRVRTSFVSGDERTDRHTYVNPSCMCARGARCGRPPAPLPRCAPHTRSAACQRTFPPAAPLRSF
eukprot:227097-Chlamydomonas_euryale.AAC.1